MSCRRLVSVLCHGLILCLICVAVNFTLPVKRSQQVIYGARRAIPKRRNDFIPPRAGNAIARLRNSASETGCDGQF